MIERSMLQQQVMLLSSVVFLSLAGSQATMCKRKERNLIMKDKKDKTGKRDKKGLKTSKKDMKTLTTPVPTTVTELSEEDLKKVTGGVSPRDVASGYLK